MPLRHTATALLRYTISPGRDRQHPNTSHTITADLVLPQGRRAEGMTITDGGASAASGPTYRYPPRYGFTFYLSYSGVKHYLTAVFVFKAGLLHRRHILPQRGEMSVLIACRGRAVHRIARAVLNRGS